MKTAIIIATLIGVAFGVQTVSQFINDNAVLNYALTLEQFEASLYESGYGFTDTQYIAAGYPAGTAAAVQFIGNQERIHATQLKALLGLRGWPSVPQCSYNFTATGFNTATPSGYLNLLAAVEAVGTGAYDGAAGAITDKNILTVAAGIATVEARHTTVLNYILNAGFNGSVVPNVETPALTFDQAIAKVAPYLLICPSNTTTPTYYNKAVTVVSSNPPTYQWQSAASIRPNQGDEDDDDFYASNKVAQTNDIAILQYALTLENLEAAFYSQFSALYSVNSIMQSMTSPNASLAQIISNNIALIASHESQHVTYLKSAIPMFSPGTQGNAACTYNFQNAPVNLNSSSTFVQFINAAAVIENTGVSAYDGAIKYIIDSNIAGVAATIATVEGNHAAYLASLVADASTFVNTPKPSVSSPNVAAFTLDAPALPGNVVNTVSPLIVSCPSTNSAFFTSTGNFVDYFNDQNQAYNGPFVFTTSTTGNAATVAASFAMVSAAVAAML